MYNINIPSQERSIISDLIEQISLVEFDTMASLFHLEFTHLVMIGGYRPYHHVSSNHNLINHLSEI